MGVDNIVDSATKVLNQRFYNSFHIQLNSWYQATDFKTLLKNKYYKNVKISDYRLQIARHNIVYDSLITDGSLGLDVFLFYTIDLIFTYDNWVFLRLIIILEFAIFVKESNRSIQKLILSKQSLRFNSRYLLFLDINWRGKIIDVLLLTLPQNRCKSNVWGTYCLWCRI